MTRAVIFFLLAACTGAFSQELKSYQQPGLYNPLVPGYFADPTVKKIGNTYYLFATTDGNGWGAGPSQVWVSEDFVNWSLKPMNWPGTHWYWAPDVTRGYDGRYYLYYSQPVEIFGASSDQPAGPWTPLNPDGKSIIPNYRIPGVITLDAQTFTDDDGSIYMFWGTWGIYPGHGCAAGLLNRDMKTFSRVELIPNTVAKDFFEAPFMFKRNGIYYLMYSSGRCEDHTYRVQYLKSTTGPFGPYEYPAHNPVLVTNDDGSVHGPGHHSILQEGEDYYIIYHRHNNPHSGGGFHRQLAADKIVFDEKGDIARILPTHEGIGFLAKNTLPYPNLALGKATTASSEYNADFRAAFAADDNNGTLWRAGDNMNPAWLQIDLGETRRVRTILTQFEYATWYYEYRIDYSEDGTHWKTFADKRNNRRWGSPMADTGDARMRYIRLHIFDTQVPGLPKGIWNIKIYEEKINREFYTSDPQKETGKPVQKGLLVDLSADNHLPGELVKDIPNRGKLSGAFRSQQGAYIDVLEGKKCFVISDKNCFTSDFKVPASLSRNSSYTVVLDALNPEIDRYEPFLSWSAGRQDITLAEFGYGSDAYKGAVTHGSWPDMPYKTLPEAGKWHRIAITFDGYMEKIWINGRLVSEANKMLFVRNAENFVLGTDAFRENFFDGAIASLKVYDRALGPEEIFLPATSTAPPWYFSAIDTEYDTEKPWPNRGTKGGTAAAVKAVDFNGKQSVIFDGQPLLSEIVAAWLLTHPAGNLTFQACPVAATSDLYRIAEVRPGRWYTITVNGSGNYSVNGIPQKGRLAVHTLTLNHTAVSRWIVSEDRDLHRAWQNARPAPVMKSIRVSPVTPGDVLVAAAAQPEPGTRYYFSNGKNSSGWINKTHYLFQQADLSAPFTAKARDEQGNISAEAVFNGKLPQLTETSPDLSGPYDLLKEDKPAFWTGHRVHSNTDTLQAVIMQENGGIRLGSLHSSWSGQGKEGPFLYKTVTGDFTFTAELSDLVGQKEKRSTATEAGIMVRSLAGEQENHIQNTVLTGWNIGNMTTHTHNGRRIQKNNGAAWNYMRFLQVQKVENTFYLRASHDGKNWQELPGSPVTNNSLSAGSLAVGLFQSSNNNVSGYGVFRNIRLLTTSPSPGAKHRF